MMRVISLNVATPSVITWRGETFTTGIYKQPVEGKVRLRTLNFDGDRQADLSVHGGPLKAVYAYASEHYAGWRDELSSDAHAATLLSEWGAFGENLTTEGLTEDNVQIGDQFRMGTARVMAVQPRQPCYKLVAKFDRDEIADRMMRNGFSGIYFSVLEEGDVQAGDEIVRLSGRDSSVSVAEVNRLIASDRLNISLLRRAVQVTELPEGYIRRFQSRLRQLEP